MKKIIASMIIVLILIGGLFVLTGCGKLSESEKTTESKKNTGFHSQLKVSSSSDIEKYPVIKNEMIELETKILNENIDIKKIDFSETNNQLIFTFYFNDENDKLFYYYSLNKEKNEFEFDSCSLKFYKDESFDKIKKILTNNLDFTDEEIAEIEKITESGDYKRIRNYLIDYEESNYSLGLLKSFRIMTQL